MVDADRAKVEAELDLTAELDAAEDIVMGRAETVVTEWGIRYDDFGGTVGIYGTSRDDERRARHDAEPGALVRRTVTYGPWETAPGA